MIVLDTNVLSELMRPEPAEAVLHWMAGQPGSALYVTTLSYAEILLGIGLMPEGQRRRRLAEQADGMFAEEFAGQATVLKLNVDEDPEIAGRYSVQSIPTLLIFKAGQKVGELVGGQNTRQIIEAALSEHL